MVIPLRGHLQGEITILCLDYNQHATPSLLAAEYRIELEAKVHMKVGNQALI